MKRAEGTKGISLIECINPNIGKYRIRWDIRSEEGGSSTEDGGSSTEDGIEGYNNRVSFYETEIVQSYMPRLSDIKAAILNAINADTRDTIVSGFVWRDIPVWLSSENQFNYKAAYDLTLQSGGQTLPVLFKFGSTEQPVYHSFETVEELSDFYIGAMRFISDTLAVGWEMKDTIDWAPFEEALESI